MLMFVRKVLMVGLVAAALLLPLVGCKQDSSAPAGDGGAGGGSTNTTAAE